MSNTGSLSPYQKEAVYRIDGQSGQITKAADEPFKPNGIAFSHDYKKVYVCDTGITHYPNAKNIVWQYDLDGAKLSNPRTLFDAALDGKSGFPDGIRVDVDGNIWAGIGWVGDGYDGVHLRARRHTHRLDQAAGDLRQRLLRRRQAQSPVHGRQPIVVCGLCRDPGRAFLLRDRCGREVKTTGGGTSASHVASASSPVPLARIEDHTGNKNHRRNRQHMREQSRGRLLRGFLHGPPIRTIRIVNMSRRWPSGPTTHKRCNAEHPKTT